MADRLYKTVKPSGGDYTSLEACMDANEQNLVTADKYFDVEISGTWSSKDTTNVIVHNYTTDATRYVHIYTVGDSVHDGTPGNGYINSGTGWGRLRMESNYTILEGISVEGNDGISILNYSATNVTYLNVILKGGGFALRGSSSKCINCISIDSPSSGFMPYGDTNGGGLYPYPIFYNCTSVGATNHGFASNTGSDSRIFVYNSAAFGSGNADFDDYDSYDSYKGVIGDYLASSDGSADLRTGATNYLENLTMGDEITDGGNGDASLKSGSSLINAGNDYSGTHSIDYDIIGTSRPQGTAWDIGAFEYISAVSTIKRRLLMGVGA